MTLIHSLFGSISTQRSLTSVGRLVALSLGLAPTMAQAHPGHPWSTAETRHLITSPDHLAALVGIGALLLLSGLFVRRTWPRQLLQTLGTTAIVVSALLWSLRS